MNRRPIVRTVVAAAVFAATTTAGGVGAAIAETAVPPPAVSRYEGLVVASSTSLVKGERAGTVTMTVTNLTAQDLTVSIPATIPTPHPADVALTSGTFHGHRWVFQRLAGGSTASLRYTPM